jgi:hypothetical protein
MSKEHKTITEPQAHVDHLFVIGNRKSVVVLAGKRQRYSFTFTEEQALRLARELLVAYGVQGTGI